MSAQDSPKVLVPPAMNKRCNGISKVPMKMVIGILNNLESATKGEELFGTELDTHTHKHAQSTLKPHQQCRTNHTSKRSTPHPPHTRGTFHRRPEPLYPKKTQGFVPRLSPKPQPMQHPCSHYNAFAICSNQPVSIYAHRNTTLQHSCSHSNAICDQELQITL